MVELGGNLEGSHVLCYSHIVIALVLPENTRAPEILAVDQKVKRWGKGVAWVEEYGIKDSIIVIDRKVRQEVGIQVELRVDIA